MPYPYSSFFNEATSLLRDLAVADAGGETTPEFERARDAAREYLKRIGQGVTG